MSADMCRRAMALALLIGCMRPHARAVAQSAASETLASFRDSRELRGYLTSVERRRDERNAAWLRAHPNPAAGSVVIDRRRAGKPTLASRRATDGANVVIAGEVRDVATGRAVASAGISIQGTPQQGITDSTGSFILRFRLEKGSAPRGILVRRIGYEHVSAPLRIGAGDSLAVRAALAPSMMRLQASVAVAQNAPTATTNVQVDGVDEGGIVKAVGERLLVLRRGRLVSINTTRGALVVDDVAKLNAGFPDDSEAWFDELLLFGSRAVVIGYRFDIGATEIQRFDLEPDGRLTHRDTHHIDSDDYYSARDYSARLVHGKLLLALQSRLRSAPQGRIDGLPRIRRWKATGDTSYRALVAPHQLFRLPVPTDAVLDLVAHTVVSCDVTTSDFRCTARGVIGGADVARFVSPTASYVWIASAFRRDATGPVASTAVRFAHGDGAPSAVQSGGMPVDQFSFSESSEGDVRVLVRDASRGNWMWRAESAAGDAALLTVKHGMFSDGRRRLGRRAMRPLEVEPSAKHATFINRWIGDHLLYGTGNGESRPGVASATLHIVSARTGRAMAQQLAHGVDRIEPLGAHALVAGSNGARLTLDVFDLSTPSRRVATYAVPEVAQAETRSHAFFYRPDSVDSGTLALPVRNVIDGASSQWQRPAAEVLFIDWRRTQFVPAGALAARATDRIGAANSADEGCDISCVDWYGNSRPLFVANRLFALMGSELVEGERADGNIREIRRLDFGTSR